MQSSKRYVSDTHANAVANASANTGANNAWSDHHDDRSSRRVITNSGANTGIFGSDDDHNYDYDDSHGHCFVDDIDDRSHWNHRNGWIIVVNNVGHWINIVIEWIGNRIVVLDNRIVLGCANHQWRDHERVAQRDLVGIVHDGQ
jgi:hypothetical protein